MIAITGINGLLGSFIAQRLLHEKLPVMGIRRGESDLSLVAHLQNKISWQEAELLDANALAAAFLGVDTVIHAAGLVSFNPRKVDQIFAVNTEGTRNVVNACLASGVKRLIFVSSVAALGRQKDIDVMDEEAKWEESSLNSHYAESKYLAELEVYRGQEEGLHVSIVNPSVILAPTNWNKSSAQLFKYVWQQQLFYTAGKLNYVDARDVADCVYLLLNRKESGDRFIISAGQIEFIDMFREIARRFHRKVPRIQLNKNLVSMAAFVEEWRARLIGDEPVITRQSVKMTKGNFYYNPQKSLEELSFQYRPLAGTLDWCCSEFLVRYSINKD